MGACCNADGSKEEFDTTRPSLKGVSGPDDQMMRLVKVQAFVKGYLYRKKYRQYKENPAMFDELYPDLASVKESTTPYFCEGVQEVVAKLGAFRFEDEQSEQMLKKAGGVPTEKEM